ncbi:type II 3-dehydroquinate dehydratase [Marinigracilibium pacificum]|uniref:3-dehydroquinate dehydratase n=1 Tax=Marinigracilibium pacificum TaxID=2729599 RepID=A0A848J3I2_9BACT|nr:type II 3-dehydroquinate dehydratase [Marinigracilibium pacificum]NMM49090.1 type II 3-dehydroquinate dehydratase [Marinigracilibium pacificum]
MNILILNGPNLNLLGKREPEIYGNEGFETFLKNLQNEFQDQNIEYYQSNIEGEIINKIHEYGFIDNTAIILNAGGYTHTSVAISDAIAGIKNPVMEVHISNIYKRENFRHKSIISKECIGMISGLGLQGYFLAIQYFVNQKLIK